MITGFPDIRQHDHYSCGAAASMAVGQYFGVGPKTLDAWKGALGTDVEKSTSPKAIIAYFEQLGMKVEANQDLTIWDLKTYSEDDMPVICPVQDYGSRREPQAQYNYGHYLTVIGLCNDYVICQDSSEDNILIPNNDSIQAPGKILITLKDWQRIWRDEDGDGNKYIQYGIAIGRQV